MVYLNNSVLQVRYAFRKNGRWHSQTIDTVAGRTEDFDRFSIVIDDDDRPYLGYYDAGQGLLKIAHSEAPGRPWMVEAIDENGAGFTNSMQISQGTLWVSYADENRMALKVARKTLAPLSPLGPAVTDTAKK